jgi:hypothetical protein
VAAPLTSAAAYWCVGWAELQHGFADDAVANLEYARERHVVRKHARAWVDLTTGLLAEAYLAVGDQPRAREMAEACGARPHARLNLLRSKISQARVFRSLDGAAAQERVDSILAEADRLVEESGAVAYRPLVAEERARMTAVLGNAELAREQLLEALSGYRTTSAVGHIARLESELGE